MLIEKVREQVERVNSSYKRKPRTNIMEGIFILDPKKKYQATDAARCLGEYTLEMAQALVRVDAGITVLEANGNLSSKTALKLRNALEG